MWYQEVTINTYNNYLSQYVKYTPSVVSGDFGEWIDLTLSYISQDASILELWTWLGRDADYIESLWYSVMRSDVSDSFIQHNIDRGNKIIHLDALCLDSHDTFDLVFANAVLLHFTDTDLCLVLENIYRSLRGWWIVAFTMKAGDWSWYSLEKMGSRRYYHYRSLDWLSHVLKQSGFVILYESIVSNGRRIHLIAQKI